VFTEKELDKKRVKRVLYQLNNLLNDYNLEVKNNNIALLILSKLLKEIGICNLEEKLLNAVDEKIQIINLTILSNFYEVKIIKEIPMALSLLKEVNLKKVDSKELLAIFDEVIHSKIKSSREPKIPRWLADFMVKLANIKNESRVANIYNSNGEITTAVRNNNSETILYGISFTSTAVFWSIIEQIIITDINELKDSQLELFNQRDGLKQDDEIFTHIISAPYFGNSIIYDHIPVKSHRSEDIYIQKAFMNTEEKGRIVILVPDGLLFAEGNRAKLRTWIFNNMEVRAIISLERGVLAPYSDAKTNILVLDKTINPKNFNIFMSKIYYPAENDIMDSIVFEDVRCILNEFHRWDKYRRVYLLQQSWVVSREEIDINNLTVDRYLPMEFLKKELGVTKFPTMPLKEITVSMKNGKTFKKRNFGPYKVIGSSAVRKLNVNKEKLMLSDGLPSNAFITRPGDILINGLGEQIGEAALVDDRFSGLFVGQHVIWLSPKLSVVCPEYLQLVLNSSYVQNQIKQRIGGTVLKTITQKRIMDVLIPLPSFQEQEEIIEEYYFRSDQIVFKKEELKEVENIFEDFISNIGSEKLEV
jgi:type I restriction-modification system DNA methylase subunit